MGSLAFGVADFDHNSTVLTEMWSLIYCYRPLAGLAEYGRRLAKHIKTKVQCPFTTPKGVYTATPCHIWSQFDT